MIFIYLGKNIINIIFWVLIEEENEYILIYFKLMIKIIVIFFVSFIYSSKVSLIKYLYLVLVVFIYEVME